MYNIQERLKTPNLVDSEEKKVNRMIETINLLLAFVDLHSERKNSYKSMPIKKEPIVENTITNNISKTSGLYFKNEENTITFDINNVLSYKVSHINNASYLAISEFVNSNKELKSTL